MQTEITVQTLNIIAQQLKLSVLTAVYPNEQRLRFFYPHAEMFSSKAHFHARAFNPGTGNAEDVATGVAAAALAGVLKRNFL